MAVRKHERTTYDGARAGIPAPEGTTILVAERKYVSESDPYSGELL